MPSPKGVNFDNALDLFNKRQAKLFEDRINFLEHINVEKFEKSDKLKVTGIDKKKLDMYVKIRTIENTNLKIGRIGRINLAVFCGRLTIKESERKRYELEFSEADNAKEAFVIIPIEKYTRRYLVEKFNLKYFGFAPNCIIGVTNMTNVAELFR